MSHSKEASKALPLKSGDAVQRIRRTHHPLFTHSHPFMIVVPATPFKPMISPANIF